ncbi:hypothetical protein U1Q18_001573 [Sarracenia purpurea var. burkii]
MTPPTPNTNGFVDKPEGGVKGEGRLDPLCAKPRIRGPYRLVKPGASSTNPRVQIADIDRASSTNPRVQIADIDRASSTNLRRKQGRWFAPFRSDGLRLFNPLLRDSPCKGTAIGGGTVEEDRWPPQADRAVGIHPPQRRFQVRGLSVPWVFQRGRRDGFRC